MNDTILFPSYGYLLKTLPKKSFHELEKIISSPSIANHSASNSLVGHIKEEYWIDKDKLDSDTIKYIIDCCHEYDNNFNYSHLNSSVKNFYIDSIWVNYQKKYEFNPIHDHSGLFSFVIWMKIPYNLEDEIKWEGSSNCPNPTTSMFNFHYVSHLGRISTISLPLDKKWEGKMIVFPATLSHSVNPFFTSDDYRISIAGNVSWTL